MPSLTLSQSISQALVNDIVAGRLSPGARLDEQSVARRFKVSRSPVRDALRELVATQLIEYRPRRGFSVATIDYAKLRDLYEGFSEIEALCARLFAMRAGSTDRASLEQIHDSARAAALKNDSVAYAAVNEEFHAAIYSGARNQTLCTIALEARRRLAPFRSKVFFKADRIEASMKEHDAIVKALLSHNAERAGEAMRRHTSRTGINVMKHLMPQEHGSARRLVDQKVARDSKKRKL